MSVSLHRARPAFVVLILILSAALADAQSGRRKPEQPPPPIPVVTPTPILESPASASKVTSLLVTGEIIHDSQYFKSSYMDRAIKEFILTMRSEPRPFYAATKGGEMKLAAAIETAKKQTDVHVIWLGMVTVTTGLGEMQLSHIEYSLLAPVSGKVVTAGTLRPGEQKIVAQGGVMQIPRMSPRQLMLPQMRQGAREVVYRLKSTGWFQ